MRKIHSNKKFRLQGGLILVALLLPMLAYPGIPEPPMVLLGKLETPGGLQVTSGALQFRFTPTGGGTTVAVDATVSSFGSGYSFYAILPLESAISGTVSAGVLKYDGTTTYTASVRYNGSTVSSSLPSPFIPQRAGFLELSPIVVQPEGPTVATSPGINFSYVQVGTAEDREFLLWNVGNANLTGTIRLGAGEDFHLMEDGNPVSEIAIDLAPGQTLTVTVRLAPTASDNTLSDLLEIRTNGGNVDRPVYGNSAAPAEYDCDVDGNGVVDHLDLLLVIQNWQRQGSGMQEPRTDFDGDNVCNEKDLLIFLDHWHR